MPVIYMKKTLWIYIIVVVVVIAGLVWLAKRPKAPGALDAFASCITDSGTKFYGAFWCPHCAAQKKEFGSSVDLLPYIECSNPDGNSQNATCNAAGIKSYPTWVFPTATGTATTTGEQPLASLAQATGCTLPAGY